MLKSKEFILMDVIDVTGKRIGFINDVLLDFNKGEVTGFSICCSKFFQKSSYVFKEDIISFNKKMVVGKISKGKHLQFQDIKQMDIIDCKGNIIGVVEEIVFQYPIFEIKGVVISSGFIRNLMYGKKILLPNRLLLGEENILYFGEGGKYNLLSMPHGFYKEVDENEEKT